MRRSLWCVGLVLGLAACNDHDDRRAPDTVLDEVPAELSNQARVRIVFHANGDANNFYCQLDGGDVIECIPPFEADVAEGAHQFRVAAALGKAFDTTPAEYAWSTDLTPPDTAIALAPPALDNSLTPTFEFSGTDVTGGAVTFECSLDDDPFAACTSPASLVVVDGAHTFRVRGIDVAGNADPTPAEHAWTIDATAPETLIVEGPTNGATTGRAASFTFMSNDASATFECKLDDAAYAPCTAPRSFANLAGGAHTFTVRAKDASAVDPSPASRTWTVDATPPDVSITQAPSDPSNDALPDFAFSSTDATATFECQIDGVVTFEACTSPWTGPTVPEGARTFRVRATDPYGNASPASVHAWIVDLTAPETTLVATEPTPTADATGDFTFASSTMDATFECSIDNGPFAACTSPFSTTTLTDGPHTFAVRAVDSANNVDASPATHAWNVDATPPETTIAIAPADPTNDATADFAFSSNETATFECSLDNAAFASCTSPLSTAALGDGAHTFAVRARDGVGNVDATPATHAWTVDTTPPETTIASAPSTVTNDTQATFTFAGNPSSGATFECALDGDAFAACTSPHARTVAEGAHTFRVRASDALGNVDPTPATHAWTVDVTPPSVSITDAPPATWPVGYYDFAFSANEAATFTCQSNSGPEVACSSTEGIVAGFADGASTYTVRATDAAGNVGQASAAWTTGRGLVLHYPFEQGSTANTSLLAQRPAYSPDGAAATQSAIGGWAGTALGRSITATTYASTRAPLSSGTGHTASMWIRLTANGTGTLVSTAATGGGGFTLSVVSRAVRLVVGGQTAQVFPAQNRWVSVAVRSSAGTTELWIDGALAATLNVGGAFDATQAQDMTVGGFSFLDLDDLRFYNVALDDAAMCTTVARGTVPTAGGCTPLAPGGELDLENDIASTGAGNLAAFGPFGDFSFVESLLGHALHVDGVSDGFGLSNLKAYTGGIRSGRSFSFSFDAGGAPGTIVDTTTECGIAVPRICGISVTHDDDGTLAFFAQTQLASQSATVALPSLTGFTTVVVTEQRSAQGFTETLSCYVRGKLVAVLDLGGTQDVYALSGDDIFLPQRTGQTLDDFEFWPVDLSADEQMLCENGFDGELDHVTNVCSLTSN